MTLGRKQFSFDFVFKLEYRFFATVEESECDQVISQSRTADQPRHREEVPQNTNIHQEDNLSKAASSLFLVKVIAKLGKTPNNA